FLGTVHGAKGSSVEKKSQFRAMDRQENSISINRVVDAAEIEYSLPDHDSETRQRGSACPTGQRESFFRKTGQQTASRREKDPFARLRRPQNWRGWRVRLFG